VERDEGVQFPMGEEGARSSMATGRAVFADAAGADDPSLAARIAASRDWRADYVGVLRELLGHDVAAAALDAVHTRLVYVREDEERPLRDALEIPPSRALPTTVVPGEGARVRELELPVGGQLLRGDALRRKLDDWVAGGIVEPGCAAGVTEVLEHPEWLALEGRRIVLLGAGAEMGPLEPLALWGADVLAVDLPSQRDRVRALARAGSGTVRLPGDGVDLLSELPELRAWIGEHGEGAELVVASHVYADGAAHVRLAAAADVLVAHLPGAGYAALATPTDCYVVPEDAVEEARRRWRRRGPGRVLRVASAGRLLRPAYEERRVADGVVRQQGPNYALAKRVQRWRAAVAAREGRAISLNLAPATTTRSVMRNRVLAAAYAGARRFGVEVFSPATTRVLMAALLVRDLHRPAPPADPDEALAESAVHGGLWRIPYDLRSALPLAALSGLPRALLRRP
jgi:hypothetical protein